MSMPARTLLVALISLTAVPALAAPASAAEPRTPPTQAEMVAMLETVDARTQSAGDYKAHAFIQQRETGKDDIVYEAVIYRRDADGRFMVLFIAPRSQAGQGYLRIDSNLWFYTPTTGKWERRTERERIAGTDSRRADLDASRLAEEYTPHYLGEGKLGPHETVRLRLEAKPGEDVPWPIIEIDLDRATGNVLKRQERDLSGRLTRTAFFPRWHRIATPDGEGEVWYPQEMRFFDEVDKGNSSAVRIERVDLGDLDRNIFTKAWLESKSR